MTSPTSGSDGTQARAFERLHPAIRRWVWQQGWPGLRDIQAAAVAPILARDRDVVVTAPTAGGKTEAAFLPILSELAGHDGPGLRCLSVAPLRALINDQTRRLEPICEAAGVTFQPWHGDVSKGRDAFWRKPANVLMTTPESLEALLMLRGRQFGEICRSLRYIVVDELHAFFGSERGAQLQSLLSRVQVLAAAPVPRVALSATLADMQIAGNFLRPGGGMPLDVISGSTSGGSISIVLRAVPKAAPPPPPPPSLELVFDDDNAPIGELPSPPGQPIAEKQEYVDALDEVSTDLFARLRGESNLVFANARRQVELVADQLRERSEGHGLPNEFFAHHGALSRELRVSLEDRLREGKLPTTAVCTSTLEMGIDIGDVSSIAQIGPAPSVSSLKQRVGRSGRRSGRPQVLRQFVIEPALDERSNHVDFLRFDLLQATATVELMLAGRFEPPIEDDLHLSTLVQQILSCIVQNGGGADAAAIYRQLCALGSFRNVTPQMFARVLRSLGSEQVLEQSADGTLLPGEKGEKLTSHYSFYATFQSPDEYVLLSGGRRLGSLPIVEPLAPGQFLLFAGRRWRIISVDDADKVVVLEPSRGGKPPNFGGSAIGQHRIVHERMRELLLGSEVPRYLDERAQQLLAQARAAAKTYGLAAADLYAAGDAVYLAHWSGSRIGATLALWLQMLGFDVGSEGPVLRIGAPRLELVQDAIRSALAAEPPDSMSLARQAQNIREDKLDWTLSDDLLYERFARRHVDVGGAREVLQRVASEGGTR